MTSSEDLRDFTICSWSLAGVDRQRAEALRSHVAKAHAGGALVETCQRIEAYAAGAGCSCAADRRVQGFAAILHLATVAAGLDSAVLGEAQVLGQVRAGVHTLRGTHSAVVDAAIAAARQLRPKPASVRPPATFSTVRSRLLELSPAGPPLCWVPGWPGRWSPPGPDPRLRTRCRRLAPGTRRPARLGADQWLPLDQIVGAGPFAVAVACLGPSAPELSRDHLPRARGYIDLGSPPNLAAGVRPVVRLTDIIGAQRSDPVEAGRREGLHRRLREILESRLAMARERSDTPVGRIRREVEAVRLREVARIARLHPEFSPRAIEDLTRGLVSQIFHTPSERLRAIDDPELGERLADLFATEGTTR